MPGLLDPVIATLAAAVVGVTGPATAPPPAAPLSACVPWQTGGQGAADAADLQELRSEIRALVAELRAGAGRSSDPRTAQAAAALARVGADNRSGCTGDHNGPPVVMAVASATGLAASIINALAAAGALAPRSADDRSGDDDESSDPDKDGGGEQDEGDDKDKDKEKEKEKEKEKDPPDRQEPPRTGPADPPPVEPTPRPAPAPAPYPAPGGSPAAAFDELIRGLAAKLQASSDPAMRELGEELLGILGGEGPREPTPESPGAGSSVMPSGATELFTDDFEGGDLSQWGTCQGAGVNGDCAGLTVADGMGVGEDPERGMVAQFRVEDGKASEVGGERSEVRDDDPEMVTKEGDDRWYSWSMKFPEDFPEPDGGWYIVLQWHQSADSGSPPLAIDISKGTVDIGGDGSDGPRQTIGQIRRGEWVDYVLHAGFSADDGFVEAWEDGQQTVEKTPRTTMTDDENYLKMGIYRDEGATGDAEVWIDDFTIHDGAGGSGGTGGARPDPPGESPDEQPKDSPEEKQDEKDEKKDEDKGDESESDDEGDSASAAAAIEQASAGTPVNRTAEQPWHPLGTGRTSGVSGAVLLPGPASEQTALIVRDNKEPDQNRLATVTLPATGAPVVTPITWQGDLPADIEAISAVPDHPGEYVTLTSAGAGHRIRIDGTTATVIGEFDLPGGDLKYEGFALAVLEGRPVAVWADRGNRERPSTVSAATIDLATMALGPPVTMEYRAAGLPADARDVADLIIGADGRLLVAAAWEAGDDGPFDGALHDAGTAAVTPAGITLTPSADSTPLHRFDGHKVEAIACADGMCVIGADNENAGGEVRTITDPRLG